MVVVAAALLVPGGLLSLFPDWHWLARLLIAIGLFIFAIGAGFAALRGDVSTRFEQSRQVSLAGRIVLFAIGGLAVVAAIDELLPDPYRSSTVLVAIAAAIGVLLVGFLVAKPRSGAPSSPRR
jgi:dolichol kinase